MKGWSNGDIPGATPYVPEKKLLAAILQRAITDYVTGEGDIKESAFLWIMDKDIESPISFSFICEALDIDSDCLKGAIFNQRKADSIESTEIAASSAVA